MRGHDKRESFGGKPRDRQEHVVLMVWIEVGGRLVHQETAGSLGQPARDQRQLPLAAADLGVDPAAQRGQLHGLKRPIRRETVLLPGRGKQAEVRSSSHQDDVPDGVVEDWLVQLRDEADLLRPVPG